MDWFVSSVQDYDEDEDDDDDDYYPVSQTQPFPGLILHLSKVMDSVATSVSHGRNSSNVTTQLFLWFFADNSFSVFFQDHDEL